MSRGAPVDYYVYLVLTYAMNAACHQATGGKTAELSRAKRHRVIVTRNLGDVILRRFGTPRAGFDRCEVVDLTPPCDSGSTSFRMYFSGDA